MLKNPYAEQRSALTQGELNAILAAHERYVASQGGMRAQLAHKSLDGLNLANRNLAEADFSGSSLVGANLAGSNLERASLYCADLRDANLQSAKMARADLRGASFNGARLMLAVLDRADLRAAMMMYVGSDGVSVVDNERRKASGAAMGVDFSNCSLKGASFGNAKLDGANFTGALLQGANFKSARLTNVTFANAVLTGVNIAELGVPPEALGGCIRDVTPEAAARFEALKDRLDSHQSWITSGGNQGAPANLDGEDLRPLHQLLVGRPLTGLSARRAVAVGLDFSGSQIQAAKLDGADLRDANFSSADLRGTSLRGARLAHARFDKANLCSLPLANGATLAPNFEDSYVCEMQFFGAIRDGEVAL
jgi:uncharacterized protein YjbI with pentapeptide repeats